MSAGLGLWALTESAPGADEPHRFVHVRDSDEEELTEVATAQRLLQAMLTTDSPITLPKEALADLHECVGDMLVAMAQEEDYGRRLWPKLNRRYSDWLAAFKSFEDKTKSWISQSFGDDSSAYMTFQASLREQWESNAGYRYATALRNAAIHANGSVLNRARLQAANDRVDLQLTFDGPTLAEGNRRLNAKVRAEWAEIEEPIDGLQVATHATNGCLRAYGALVTELDPEISAMWELLKSLIAECAEVGGEWAVFASFEGADLDTMNTTGPQQLAAMATTLADLQRISLENNVVTSATLRQLSNLSMPRNRR